MRLARCCTLLALLSFALMSAGCQTMPRTGCPGGACGVSGGAHAGGCQGGACSLGH